MAWKTLVSDRSGWLRDTNAMLVSACCHFGLLIVVALVSIVSAGGGDGTKLVVSLGNKGDESAVVDNSLLADSPSGGEGQAIDRSPLQAEHQLEAALGPANALDTAPLFTSSAIATKPEIDVGPLALPTSP